MSLSEKVQYFARTDVGRLRDHNEDNYLVDKKLSLSVVADGMGGHAAGEVASALAVRIIHEEIKAHRDVIDAFGEEGADERAGSKEILNVLEQAVNRACQKIHEEAKADPAKRGMGTTLSALLIAGSQGFIAHVGDSRIYLLRGGKIQQVTEDHTVYNELVKRGKLTRDQIEKVAQKNAITRAVGVYERVEVDTLTIEVLPGDQFLLASDGLHGYIAHTAELEPYLEEADGETAAEELIALANRKGGKDNITAVLVYANGKFGQLIEGEPAGMEITVERIRQSRRHKSLLVIGEGATRQRLFPQWSLQLEADPALLRSTLQALNKGHDYSAEHVDCAERMLRLVAWERDGATSQP